MKDYQACILNLVNYSKNASIFVLIHKLDRINESERKKVKISQIYMIKTYLHVGI